MDIWMDVKAAAAIQQTSSVLSAVMHVTGVQTAKGMATTDGFQQP